MVKVIRSVLILDTDILYFYYAPPAVGGIKRYRDPSVCLSVCLSQP